MAAYAAAAGLECEVFMPKDVKVPFIRECELYGATVTLVDGLITDAGRIAAETRQAARLVRRLDAEGAVPHRGQEDDGVRAGRAARVALPDWIIYPTGGGTGLVGMWKAFEEMEAIGWKAVRTRPRMVSVQADGCAPIVRAFEQGTERPSRGRTPARWPTACACRGHRRLPRAAAVRESGGTALAVTDADMVADMREIGSPKASAPRPKAAPRCTRIRRWWPTAASAPTTRSCSSTPAAR
jgi:threonine synthase